MSYVYAWLYLPAYIIVTSVLDTRFTLPTNYDKKKLICQYAKTGKTFK